MFICQFCQRQTKKGEKLTLVPVEYHEVEQPYPLPSTKEIKVEKRACQKCAANIKAKHAEALAETAKMEAEKRLAAKFNVTKSK